MPKPCLNVPSGFLRSLQLGKSAQRWCGVFLPRIWNMPWKVRECLTAVSWLVAGLLLSIHLVKMRLKLWVAPLIGAGISSGWFVCAQLVYVSELRLRLVWAVDLHVRLCCRLFIDIPAGLKSQVSFSLEVTMAWISSQQQLFLPLYCGRKGWKSWWTLGCAVTLVLWII